MVHKHIYAYIQNMHNYIYRINIHPCDTHTHTHTENKKQIEDLEQPEEIKSIRTNQITNNISQFIQDKCRVSHTLTTLKRYAINDKRYNLHEVYKPKITFFIKL